MTKNTQDTALDVIDEAGAAEHEHSRRDDARRRPIPTKPEDVRVFDVGINYGAYGADGKLIVHPNRDALVDEVLGVNRPAAARAAARQAAAAQEGARRAEATAALPAAQEAAQAAQAAVEAAHAALVTAVVTWSDVMTAWVAYRTAERLHDRARHRVTRWQATASHGGDGPSMQPRSRYQTLGEAIDHIAAEQVRAVDLTDSAEPKHDADSKTTKK